MRAPIVFLIVAMLGACSMLSPEEKLFRKQLDQWVGRSVDEMVSANGPPSDVFLLDSGGREFEYYKRRLMFTNDTSLTRDSAKPISRDNHALSKKAESIAQAHAADALTVEPPELPLFARDVTLNTIPTRKKVKHNISPCSVFFEITRDSKIESWSMEGDCN
jgi:hypothetical protein